MGRRTKVRCSPMEYPPVKNELAPTLGYSLLGALTAQFLLILCFSFTPSTALYLLLSVPAAAQGIVTGTILWRFGPPLTPPRTVLFSIVVTVLTFLATTLMVSPPSPSQPVKQLLVLSLSYVIFSAILSSLFSAVARILKRPPSVSNGQE